MASGRAPSGGEAAGPVRCWLGANLGQCGRIREYFAQEGNLGVVLVLGEVVGGEVLEAGKEDEGEEFVRVLWPQPQ